METMKRICPKCGGEIIYKNESSKDRADRQNRNCRSCTQKVNITKRPPFSSETKKKMSIHRKGKTYKELGIVCDLAKRGINISNKKRGMVLTDKHRQSLREARIRWLEKNNFIFPTFNEEACKYLDKLNKEKGWNLQHALNGGEYLIAGYFVDGYDADKNIVVEYDEPFHNKPYRILKDKRRMDEIKICLQCRFYRYNVHQNELKEF